MIHVKAWLRGRPKSAPIIFPNIDVETLDTMALKTFLNLKQHMQWEAISSDKVKKDLKTQVTMDSKDPVRSNTCLRTYYFERSEIGGFEMRWVRCFQRN